MLYFKFVGFVAPGTHNEQGLDDSSPTQQKLIGNRQLMTDMSKSDILYMYAGGVLFVLN